MAKAAKIAALVAAMDARFQSIANKVTSWGETPSDNKYPSEKLVKDALDTKLESSDLPTKTSDLTNDGEDGEALCSQQKQDWELYFLLSNSDLNSSK